MGHVAATLVQGGLSDRARAVTTTAVILARGLGKRMRKADLEASLSQQQSVQADTGVKGMISVGRPLLDYILSALADAGIEETVLVIGPEHDAIRRYFDVEARPTRMRVRFAVQDEPIGTANAVVAASEVVGNSAFLALNADNYYPVDAYSALRDLEGAGVVAFARDTLISAGNIDAERVRSFAVLDIDTSGRLRGIVEKPGSALDLDSPGARWVGMNLWRVTPALVDACRRVSLSTRGEYELPEAVALALSEQLHVQAVRMEAGVLDLSQRSDIAAVTARLSTVEARP